MKTKRQQIIALLLTVVFLFTIAGNALAAPKASATTMRLERTEGETVSLNNLNGKALSIINGMKLYSGNQLTTGLASYAYISLDDTKAVKMDANSKGEVRQSGKKLEFNLTAGELFFNITEPLKSNETLNIRTSTMLTGVRGTSGFVQARAGQTEVFVLTGSVTLRSTDPATGEITSVTVTAQQKVTIVVTSDAATGQEKVEFVVEEFVEENVPGFAAVEIAKDEALQQQIQEQTPLNVTDIIVEAENRLVNDQQNASQQQQQIQEQSQNVNEDETVAPQFDEGPAAPPSSPGSGGRSDSPPSSYTVTYSYIGDLPAGAVSIPAPASYAYGATVTVAPIPNVTGYTFSAWTSADVNVTGATFTMPAKNVNITTTATANDGYGYTVNYYKDSVDAANLFGSDSGTGTFGAAIPYTDGKYLPTGYVTPGTVSGQKTITTVAADNVLNVVYGKDGAIGYTVNYYKDSVAAANLLDSDSGTGTFGAAIPYTDGKYLPAGYVTPGAVSGQQTITAVAADNVLNIVYGKDGAIGYTVNYYKDSVDGGITGANYLGTSSGTGTFGDPIPHNDDFLPTGYVTPGAVSGQQTITAVAADNVMNVVYSPVPTYSVSYSYTGTVPAGAPALPDTLTEKHIGDEITVAVAPTMTGYTFSGWYYNDAIVTTVTMPANDVVLEGSWTVNTYTVTLNPNIPGVITTDPVTTTATYDSAELPTFTALTRTGYTLTGYYTATSDGTKVINANGALVSGVAGYTDDYGKWIKDGDASFFAQWTAGSYTVTYKVDGQQVGDVESYEFGEAVSIRDKYEKTGYTVSNWNITEGFNMPAENVEITATTTVNTHAIIYKVNDTEVKKYAAVAYGTDLSSGYGSGYTAPEGHTLSDWSATLPTTMPDNDITITATTTINTHDIIYMVNDTEVKKYEAVAYGTDLSSGYESGYTAPEGYTLSAWSATLPTTMPDNDITITATTSINSYTVTLHIGENLPAGITGFETSADGATYTAYTAAVSVNHGGSLYVKAVLDNGYGFVQWTEGVTDNPHYIENITGAVTYTPATTPILAGSGTFNYPYLIYTADHLQLMAEYVNNSSSDYDTYRTAYYQQTDDIDLADIDWEPIGKGDNIEFDEYESPILTAESHVFAGTYDGGGYSITGLTVDITEATGIVYAGLFGYVAKVYDDDNNEFIGTVKNVPVENSTFKAEITGSSGNVYAGGIVGYNEGVIDNVSYTGTVNAKSPQKVYAGGVAGYNAAGGEVKNVDVITPGGVGDSIRGESAGDMMGHEPRVGGIVGKNEGTIQNSHNQSPVNAISGSDYAYAGGVAGDNAGTVQNSYNTGAVSANATAQNAKAGGVAGQNTGTAQNTYNAGAVTATTAGGVVGYNISADSLQACYWNTTFNPGINGVGSGMSGGVYGMVDAAMKCDAFAAELNSNLFGVMIEGVGGVIKDAEDLGLRAWEQTPGNYPALGDDVWTSDDFRAVFEEVGDEDEPYEIASAADLFWLAYYVNNDGNDLDYNTAHYQQTADIDLAGYPWTPIGISDDYYFAGTYDGNNNKIKNMTVNITGEVYIYAGLFGCVDEGGTVQNVTVENNSSVNAVSTESNVHAGGIAGFNAGMIDNVSYTGNVGATGAGSAFAGGVVGENSGTVQNSNNTGGVTADATNSVYVGGVVGNNWGTVQDSHHKTGAVAATSRDEFAIAGGVVGDNIGPVLNSYNLSGVVTATSTNSNAYAGGVAGRSIASEDDQVGAVQNSYNTGAVTASGSTTAYAGGVVGINQNSYRGLVAVQNSYNTGDVEAAATGEGGAAYAGGVVGENHGESECYATVQNTYNAGNVSATSNNNAAFAGGVAGSNGDLCTLEYCYWSKAITINGAAIAEEHLGYGENTGTADNNVYGMSDTAMKGTGSNTSDLVNILNGYVTNNPDPPLLPWKQAAGDNEGYPTFDTEGGGGGQTGTYTIIYMDHDFQVFSGTHGTGYPTSHTYGTATTLVSPTKDGFTFGGWFISPHCTGTAITELAATGYTDNITLYAKWTSTSSTFSGTGSQGDPFIISAPEYLKLLAERVNAGTNYDGTYFKQTADISLSGYASWEPIGNVNKSFAGTYDGDGNSITGMNVNISENTENDVYAGLFGYVAEGGTVQNVTVSGSINGENTSYGMDAGVIVGGIVGYNEGTINNVVVSGSVNGMSTREGMNVEVIAGGSVGLNKGTINNVGYTGTVVTATSTEVFAKAGGVVGSNEGGNVLNSYNTAAVTATGKVGAYAGGVVGHNYEGNVLNSYNTNTGAVIAKNSVNFNYAGGVVGKNDGTVQNTYNAGNVTSPNANAKIGGVAGDNYEGTLGYCYWRTDGDITVNSRVGSVPNDTEGGMSTEAMTADETITGNLVGILNSNLNTIQDSDLLRWEQTNENSGYPVFTEEYWQQPTPTP